MIEIAVDTIREYIQENLFEPSFSWDKREFETRSYSRWAAYEVLNRVIDHPIDAPLDTIENFVLEMAMYAHYGKNEHRSFIFQIAFETATEIALLLV